MTNILNTRILLSGATILAAAALIIGATFAFFSDTETSTDNVFAAGAIDLQIDNTSYALDHNIPGFTGDPVGALVANPANSWTLTDLTAEKFFNFSDVKPGDYGEDTISIHVDDNDAWLCAAARITDDSDQTCTEPELEDDLACTDPGLGQGELDEELNFAFWADDGDNVFEDNESIFLSGPLSGLGEQGQIALADSTGGAFGPSPIPGDTTVFIGKIWCMGELVEAPVPNDSALNPEQRQATGFTCNGENVDNAAQTDQVVGDLQFFAVQSRNNDDFTCSEDYTPEWPDGDGEDRPTVGAALGDFTPLALDTVACDVDVDDSGGQAFTSIQAAIDDGGTVDGETVCVAEGTYNEDVVIDKEITLSGDGATATSTINGQAGGQGAAVTIAANDVTLEGFDINGAGIAALWLNTGVTDATVRYNKITSAAGVTAVTTQGSQSNHLFSNNEFVGNGASQLVYVNGDVSLVGFPSSNVDFDSNTFSGTIVAGGVALGSESTTSDVTKNIFESTLTSTYALYESWKDDALVNFNNFYDTAGVIVRNSDPALGFLNAEDNWWGEAAPTGHTAGNVDDDPKEALAFPEN